MRNDKETDEASQQAKEVDQNRSVKRDTEQEFVLTENISIPDRDLHPVELAKAMRQISRVTNFILSVVARNAALTSDNNVAGVGHPLYQTIHQCAVAADAAAVNLQAMINGSGLITPATPIPPAGQRGPVPFRRN